MFSTAVLTGLASLTAVWWGPHHQEIAMPAPSEATINALAEIWVPFFPVWPKWISHEVLSWLITELRSNFNKQRKQAGDSPPTPDRIVEEPIPAVLPVAQLWHRYVADSTTSTPRQFNRA